MIKTKRLTAEDVRKSILYLTINGKLTNQRMGESANDLLEQIHKVTKNKHSKVETEHFVIPQNWEWVYLPEIVKLFLGKTPERANSSMWNGTTPWVSIADMLDMKTINTTKETISDLALKKVFNRISKKGTLLMSFKLTVGRVSILGMDGVHNEAIVSVIPHYDKNNILRDYLKNVLGIMTNFCDKTGAIKGSTLNKKKMNKMLIPLPPLEEQKRIVDKLNKLEPLLKQYEEIENKLSNLEDNIEEQLKKSVIQTLINKDANEFNNLSEVAITIGGYAFKSSNFVDKGIRVIRISDFDEFGFKNTYKFYEYSKTLDQFKINNNDILMCMTGGTVGKTLIVKNIKENAYINQRIVLIRSKGIDPDYLYYVLTSHNIQNVIQKKKTSTNDNISMELINSFKISKRNFHDQKRIAGKINQILSLIG